jgi:hypothetical protein
MQWSLLFCVVVAVIDVVMFKICCMDFVWVFMLFCTLWFFFSFMKIVLVLASCRSIKICKWQGLHCTMEKTIGHSEKKITTNINLSLNLRWHVLSFDLKRTYVLSFDLVPLKKFVFDNEIITSQVWVGWFSWIWFLIWSCLRVLEHKTQVKGI